MARKPIEIKTKSELVKNLIKGINESYLEKIGILKQYDQEFCYCHNVRKREIEVQHMYKLLTDGQTSLVGKDGRQYEFLVEFDDEDFAYGIYFGCKVIFDIDGVKDRSNKEKNKWAVKQAEEVMAEWEQLKDTVCNVLNMTFVGQDFESRILPTDNVSDDTFWPFWFRLETDEDVYQVSATAVRIIRNVYKEFLSGNLPQKSENDNEKNKGNKRGRKRSDNSKKHLVTRYTFEEYEKTLKELNETNNGSGEAFDHFLNFLVNKGILIEAKLYEKCWKLATFNPSEFSVLVSKFSENNQIKNKWKVFGAFIISDTDEPLDNLASLYSNATDVTGKAGITRKEDKASLIIKEWRKEYEKI